MGETIIEINGRTVIHNGYFAYDKCHKLYVLEDEIDVAECREFNYDIYPINELEETYNTSCPLKFIENWKLTETYVGQGEECIFNYVESED